MTQAEIVALRNERLRNIVERLAIFEKPFVEDLKSYVTTLRDNEAQAKKEADRIRLLGDGTPEDVVCKKRGLKPATPTYERCYVDLAERRKKSEEQARLQAEREANDPFADAKKRCASIGIKPKTEAFGKCVLELTR